MSRPPIRPSSEPIRDADVRDGTVRAPQRRHRRAHGDKAEDKFEVPRELKQPGISYEWKRESVYGNDKVGDPSYLANLQDNGWEPVDVSEMPGRFNRFGETGSIRRDGMILMKRPMELTIEARREDFDIAREQVATARRQLGKDPSKNLKLTNSSVASSYSNESTDGFRTVKAATTQVELND